MGHKTIKATSTPVSSYEKKTSVRQEHKNYNQGTFSIAYLGHQKKYYKDINYT